MNIIEISNIQSYFIVTKTTIIKYLYLLIYISVVLTIDCGCIIKKKKI